MPDAEVPVLIVGGSLVGLTTAMLLGHHGVPSLSVERHAGTAIRPRAGQVQLRTMELLRQLGLEGRVERSRMRSAAILSDEPDDGALHLAPSALDGRPGTRAPHVWLADGRSTLDLFGSQFVVLRPAEAGVEDSAPPGTTSHAVDAKAYGLSAGAAMLVRPDGTVAWRSRGPAGHEEIARALATALALTPEPLAAGA
jgi:hypothetical protein